ncbi:VpsP family polysaccharide biosynthesis protein [Microbulbifer sp. CAU 1566]|uniref:VpsP family polysaccharide biosynthesis protein n=1 Tax=Microbulbifer sp. CAU 1566 TaxID=2933269 RepID=UPI0020033A7A|nr:VpsP family polysaccharide biosynthesis protein [Microbulbifer sp. CAU 1566]MCK7598392.1 VpsP family polysaccharide biosynthesis protein [Microbulbifer sp. CAU 1566]
MQTQASIESPRTRRRRRSRKRMGVMPKLRAALWPAQVGPLQKGSTWLAIFLLLALCVHAGSMGLAYLQVVTAENQLKYWYKLGKVPSAASMESAMAAIERANELHPDNPYQLTLQARLLEWRAYNAGEVVAEDYRAALALYQQAAALRPLWPDSWAEMAQIKVRLGEFDADMDRYLVRASELGPYTPAVHLAVVQAGLPRLPALVGNQRTLLQTHLIRGFQDPRSKKQTLTLVEQYGQQPLVCQWLSGSEEVTKAPKFCDS